CPTTRVPPTSRPRSAIASGLDRRIARSSSEGCEEDDELQFAMIDDVLIVGAGPAGSVTAALLARAGVRVRLLDRATFPRDKLCGDTVNPGTLAMLRRLKMADAIDLKGLRVDGMILTVEPGVSVPAPYPAGLYGRALSRAELDSALLERAIDAG